MPTKNVKQTKAPTEKQVGLLEKLMAHELEDVQKKALAIVLSIWKKKSVQEISYIIPELTEKQIRYTMKRYHANSTQYLQAMYDRWSKQRMVHELRSAHDKWAKRHQTRKTFDLSVRGFFNQYNKPLLAQLHSLGKNKLFVTVHDAYAEAGINPNCHLPVSYGATEEEQRLNWTETLKIVATTYGERVLASEYMNPQDKNDRKSIRIPDRVRYAGTDFPLSQAEKMPELRVSLVSIMQEGVSLFGTKDLASHEDCWRAAVESAGFDYADIKGQIAAANRKRFVLMFLDFLVEHKFQWKPEQLTNPKYDYISYFYKGLRSTWEDSQFREFMHAEDFLLGSLMEAYFYHEKEPSGQHKYYQDNLERIFRDIYLDQDLRDASTFDSMLQGIFRKYSNAQRVTRIYMDKEDKEKEFLGDMTRLGRGSYIDFMENMGLPVKHLDSLYHDELDDPWKIEIIYENVRRLVTESLNTGENRLLGKYASSQEKGLYRAICAKYGYWTAGLLKVGVDLKQFTNQLKTRDSMQKAFHSFFQGMLKKYEFTELKNPKRVTKEGQYSCNQQIRDTVPEFYFWDKIIETRLGSHEQEPKEKIEKLKNHTGVIILVTPDGEKSLTSGETSVLRIPFHQFVKESKTLLGVKLRHTEVQSLSNRLRRKLFWN
tara:strand:+ start:294 stop:2258 length:1965 start_codon:yes stop_codon:yes gene_type:complete